MPWGTSVMNYASKAAGLASTGFNAGAKYLGKTGMAAATGAGVGGLYGMTAGRDPGQSRLGGFMTGALGGAALGAGAYRYGGAMYRGGRSAYRAGSMGRFATSTGGNYTGAGLAGLTARGAGMRAFRQIRNDAAMARSYIGAGINRGYNAFNGLRR